MKREMSHKESMERKFEDSNVKQMNASYYDLQMINEVNDDGVCISKLGIVKVDPNETNKDFNPKDFLMENLIAIGADKGLKMMQLGVNQEAFEESLKELENTIDKGNEIINN